LQQDAADLELLVRIVIDTLNMTSAASVYPLVPPPIGGYLGTDLAAAFLVAARLAFLRDPEDVNGR